MPDELTLLDTAEQELHAQLKAVRAKRELTLAAHIEEQALAAQLRHEQVMARAAALRPVTVLGASYESVRKLARDNGLRAVRVHPDILNLLRAALPARDEQHFYQLCSALVERLMINQQATRTAVEKLRNDSATQHYFEPQNEVLVIICVVGRLSHTKSELLADIITAYCLSWGNAVAYEDSE
jgi:hypothetical protein